VSHLAPFVIWHVLPSGEAGLPATAAAATTAAATTAAAAATTTATATATGTTAAAAAAATAASLRALFGLVDAQRASVDHLAVDPFDRPLSLLVRAHGHECKATGLPCGTVSHDVDISHFAILCEGCADGLGIRVK